MPIQAGVRMAAGRVFANIWLDVASGHISGRDQPEPVDGMRTSWDYFEMLAVRPQLGRGFAEPDDRPGAPHVAVLSYGL